VALIKGRDSKLGGDFINFMLSVEAQEAHCSTIGLLPVNEKAKIPEKVANAVPKKLEHLHKMDVEAVNQEIGKWTERFNKEIKGQ